MVDKKLLDVLACPVCKGGIELHKERIICRACKKAYPVREGIPVMMEAESEPMEENDE